MIADGVDKNYDDGKCGAMGSVIVKAGCTFYAFGDHGYSGGQTIISGPEVRPKFAIDSVARWCGDETCYTPA